MKNVTMHVDAMGVLTIRIDLTKSFGSSKSGKTLVIASTEGNQPIPIEAWEGNRRDAVRVGVNVYEYPPKVAPQRAGLKPESYPDPKETWHGVRL